jgi:hypothetical protein
MTRIRSKNPNIRLIRAIRVQIKEAINKPSDYPSEINADARGDPHRQDH